MRRVGKRLSRADVKLGALAHHLTTIAAYLLTAPLDGEAARQARCAVRECVRECGIAPADIDRRREALEIQAEDYI